MGRTYTVMGYDVSGTGKAPDVTFEIDEDRSSMRAEVPGGSILLEMLAPTRSNLRLWDTSGPTASRLVADLIIHQLDAPPYPEWDNHAAYVAEIACALYWSQWRHQQLKAKQAAATQAEVSP